MQGEIDGKTIYALPEEERSYLKYGIYEDAANHTEYIALKMMADDEEGEELIPMAELTEDDLIIDKPMFYNFQTSDWEERAGLAKLISSSSFSFMKEKDFFDQLLVDVNRRATKAPDNITDLDNVANLDI